MNKGISIFVPALNEDKALSKTVKRIIHAASLADNPPFEIFIVNDGSTDNTRNVINLLERNYPYIHTIHHSTNLGWGVGFKEVIQLAKYPKIALFPGDGYITTKTLSDMMRYAYDADFVCVYLLNKEYRPFYRNIVSTLFTRVYQYTFHLPIQYINATPVYPVRLLKTLHVRCLRYSFPSEPTVKLLRTGCTYMEIGGKMNPRVTKSSALQLKNLSEVLGNYFFLIYDVYVRHRKKYRFKPVRITSPTSSADKAKNFPYHYSKSFLPLMYGEECNRERGLNTDLKSE